MEPTDANTIFEKFGWKPFGTDSIPGVTRWQFVTPAVSYIAAVAPHVVEFTLVHVTEGHDYRVPEIRASLQHPHKMTLDSTPDHVLVLALGRIADNANLHTAGSAPVSFVQYAVNEFTGTDAASFMGHTAVADNLRVVAVHGWTPDMYEAVVAILLDGDFESSPAWFSDMLTDARREVYG